MFAQRPNTYGGVDSQGLDQPMLGNDGQYHSFSHAGADALEQGSAPPPPPDTPAEATHNLRVNIIRGASNVADSQNTRITLCAATLFFIPQIIAVFVVLMKHPTAPEDKNLEVWAEVFAIGLFLRFARALSMFITGNETRRLQEMYRKWSNYLSMGFFVLLLAGNIFVVDGQTSTSSEVYVLCVSLVLINYVAVVFLPWVLLCLLVPFFYFCTPLAIRVLSYIDEANQVKQGAQEADLQSLPTCTYYHGLLDESRRQSGVAGQANSNNKQSGVGNDHESSGDRANAHASADRGEHIIDMSNSASSHNNNAHDVSSIHHNHYSAVADSSIDINDDDDGDDDDSMPSCLICTCEYEEGEEIRILPCHPTHHFHKDCVDNWLKISATCPNCRANLLNRNE